MALIGSGKLPIVRRRVVSGSADDNVRRRVTPPKPLMLSCAKDIRALRTSHSARGCQCIEPA